MLARPGGAAAAPPGVDGRALELAMLEDLVDVVCALQGVESVLVVAAEADAEWRAAAGDLVWPGMAVVGGSGADVSDRGDPTGPGGPGDSARPGDPDAPTGPGGAGVAVVLASLQPVLAGLGASEVVVVAPDAPDLPGLLLAKLYRGLAGSVVAACPADGGGLVALGCRLPAPDWLLASGVGLDTRDALGRLVAAAPRRAAVSVGPGWHRLRSPADIGRLDPGLEGWSATRAVLTAPPVSGAGRRPARRPPRAR